MLRERLSAQDYGQIDEQSSPWEKLVRATVVEHQRRYEFAASIIGDLVPVKIIDAASGSGWGVSHLAKSALAAKVTGIEIDKEAIKEARLNFSGPNIEYIEADLLEPKQLEGIEPVDWVVNFEFMEHISEKEAPIFLENLRQITTDNGRLIISTPNHTLFSPFAEDETSFAHHQKEYTSEEFVRVLKENGWGVDYLSGQLFVNPSIHYRLVQVFRPLKQLTSTMRLSDDQRLSRLPISLLHRLIVLQSRGFDVQKFSDKKQPLFMTAVCRRF